MSSIQNSPSPIGGSDKKPNKKNDSFNFFWLPTIINGVVALMGIGILGLSGLVTATICLIVGFFWAIFKNFKQGGYLMLAGIVPWLIGLSICGIMLSQH